MTKPLLAVLTVVACVAAGPPPQDVTKKEIERLRGTWEVVSVEYHGDGMTLKEYGEKCPAQVVTIEERHLGGKWVPYTLKTISFTFGHDKALVEETAEYPRWSIRPAKGRFPCGYRLNCTQTPRTMVLFGPDSGEGGFGAGSPPMETRFHQPNLAFVAIYSLNGDTLKLCFNLARPRRLALWMPWVGMQYVSVPAADKRPTRFATDRNSENVVYVLQRQKP
jgi:hypothetical protein